MAVQDGTIFTLETNLWGLVDELSDDVPFHKVQWKAGRDLPRKVYRVDSGAVDDIPSVGRVVRVIEESVGRNVASLWLNLYEGGDHWCPYHRDSYGCDVVTFSSGASRTFLTRTKGGQVEKRVLSDGDLLFFDQEFDDAHLHSVPKEKVDGNRVSVVAFMY